MTISRKIPENPDLSDVFKAYSHGVAPLLEFHDIYLRKDSPLSIGERELIAAYVSGLNACAFCFGAHASIAANFGMSEDLLRSLLDGLETAPVENKQRTLFRFLKILTLTPAKITPQLRESVFEAGYSERALHDAIVICALFNFMNRIIEGNGVKTDHVKKAETGIRHQSSSGNVDEEAYMNYGRHIGVIE